MNSTVSPSERTVEGLKGSTETSESGTQRNRLNAVRRWWKGTDSHDNEFVSKGQTGESSAPDMYVAPTTQKSDAGSVKSDSEESSIDLKVSALDWLQSNDNVVEEDRVAEDEASVSSSGLESFGSGYGSEGNFLNETVSSTRTSKQRLRDLKKVVQWMRKGKGKGREREDKYDPSGEYRKLDSMLPKSKKKGATPDDRAHEIEGALDWLRSRQDISAPEDPMQPAIDLRKFGPAPICVTRPEDRRQELHDVLTWIRNKGQGMKEQYDPNGNFRNLISSFQRSGNHPWIVQERLRGSWIG